MGIYRKALRYGLKKRAEASQGSLARTADRLKILSSVLAAGFVVLPFFCGEAFAAGSIVRVDSDKNLMQSGRADIYAESVHGDVGLNRFQEFKVGNQELANLYFRQEKDSTALNTLVNTVESRIDINGTVNAIRDNKVGGNLYFLSKDGMVVGANGVVNAGSLTVLAAENKFKDAEAASEALKKQDWELSSKGTIDVSGTLNTATGIDLRAAYINVAKGNGSSFAPQLRTGMLFYTTVNTNGLVSDVAVKDGRLTATVDSSGNVVIADPNDATNNALKGDGSIKLQASATKKNAAHLDSVTLQNEVEAKVNIAEGAKLDAAGDVLVSADATHDSDRYVVEILDIAAFAKADVQVDGELKGRNVTVTANAVNSLDSKNLKSIYDGLDRTAEEITDAMGNKITVNDALADAIGSTLEDRGVFGKGGKYFDTVNNVIEQLYMPFGFADAEATISVGHAGKLTASENINVAANSTASNNFKVEIQPKLQQGDSNKLKYFTGGFVYVDTDSTATVDIDGKLEAKKNLAVTAKAVDTSIGTMVVKPPRILDNGQGGDSKDDGSFYTGLAMAMNFQDSAAVVNLGAADSAAKDKNNPLLKAGGALTVNAVNVNTLASTASITVKENTPINTAINISSTQGKAVINDNAALEGAQVQLNSKHTLNKLSVTADSSIGPELSGSTWVVNTPQAKHGLDVLRNFLSGVNEGPKVSAAAGSNIKKDKKTWDQYFNFGMSFGLALVDNEARTNIAAGVPITATGGNLALTAAVSIADSQFATKNLLNAANRDEPLGVSAAIGVEDMQNTAEVNVAEDSGSELAARGNINITANVDNSYQRVNKLVDAVKSGWESFYDYWSKGKLEDDAADDAKAKVQQLETIVADILTIASKNSAESFTRDKQFAMKSKAAMEILTELTGSTELKNALENLLNASNYANMYVSASTDKPLMSKPDITTMITGTVGVQNLANNARVNIGAHKKLTAGADVAMAASVTEQNALLAGKWQFIPDIFTNDAGQNGLGASVGVQNAANKSEVRVNNGVGISAGSGAIAMQTANDIINTSLVMGGARTSSLGITGMVNYVGGSSAAETLLDDDVSLSAAKKLRLAAANDTVLTAVTGDFGYSKDSSVGVSTSVIDYNVKTLAQLRNLEGTDSAGKGSITASALEVDAHTDGIINNFALAGVASKSSNVNKDAGGVSTSTSDGKAKEGVEKAEVKAEEKKDDSTSGGSDKKDDKVQGTLRAGGSDKKDDSKKLEESVIKVDAAGSVAWNYVKDETDASIDNVQIELLRPAGANKTTGVDIAAEDSSYIGAYSGAAALSKFGFAAEDGSSTKFQGMLSGAIAVNDVYKSTTSALRRAELNNADNVTNLAQNSGAQAAAGLAMGVELGKRAGSVDINLGGSGSANYVDSTVQAELTGNVMKNGALNVSNVAYYKDVQAGGGINFEFSRGNAAAGAAISISDVDNKISAVMNDNTIGTQDKLAGSISNLALSNLVQVGTATSIGVLVGNKAYFMGDVAIAVNMVDNDVQAQAGSNTIYAQSVANEARDGKLQVNEKQNQYIDVINSTADNGITVEKETGKFYKLAADGSKQYIVGEGASYVYEDNGAAADLYDANNKIHYDETTGKLTDSHGRTLVFNSKRSFIDEKTKAGVDVTAAAAANILDLDASAALAQANGSQGVALGAEAKKDGSLTYTSKTLTAENAGNVIVGSAIAVAAKVSEGSYGGSAAVATNINHIKNSFNAAASDNTIAASGKDGVKITAASDTLMVAVAAGAAASAGTDKVSVDVAGSGVDNTLNNNTLASLTGGNIKADNVEVASSTKSLLVGVAGQLSAAITGQYGGAAGLTWAQSDLDNTTGAYVSKVKLTGYNGKNKLFKAKASNDGSIVTVGAGVSAAIASGAATGAYAGSYGKNDTKAVVDGDSSIESAGSIEVSAEDNSSINTASGSIEVAGSKDVAVTVGGAVANTQLGRHVQAQLNDTTLNLTNAKNINVLANDKSSTLNLALGGGVAIGGEMAGVAAQGSVAVLSADGMTQATFDNVKLQAEADDAAVSVKADSDNRLTNSADALSIGGGGLGGGALGAAVSVLTNSRDTVAQAKGGSWRAGAALVQANSKTKVEHVTTGVSAAGGTEGAGALTASVQVNVLEDKTEAYVQKVQGSVKSLTVNADRNMDIAAYNNGFALTGSMISGSVGAGVTTVDDKASILAGLADSQLQRADKNADVKVTAKNKTSIETEISSNNVALSIGAAIGTSVEVVNLEAQTAALVANTQLGDSKNAFRNIDVTADNEVSNKFTNVVDSIASLAGVAVGVGVANINTQTTATVDGSKLYADNIKVTADERRTADAQLVGAAIGGLAVGVNLMYTNLGGELQDAYTYEVWNENKQSYDTYTTYTQATDGVDKQYVTDIQGIAGEGLTGTNAALKALPANSVAEVNLNKGSAAGRVGVNIKGSTLEAGKAVQAAAHGTNNVNSDIRQAAVAGASVAVAGNRTRFREEQSVQLAEAIIKGQSVDISSLTDGDIKHYMGQGGFSMEAYSDTVSYIKHSGANKLQINGSTITATDKTTLGAQNKVQLDNKGLVVNIGGVSAGRLVLESKDSLTAGVELGKQTAGSVAGKSISITAENAGKVKDEIEAGVTVGVISVHGSSAESRALGAADVYVGAGSSLRADSVTLQAKTGRDSDYTTEAINHAVSVSGVDVTINRALTENAMQSNVYLGDISAGSKLAALRVQALNNNSSNAYVYSFGLGVIAGSGNNFAKAEENSSVAISLDGGKGLTLQQLDVLAENVQSVTAKADGSASALLEISPYTAKVTHDAKAQTSVTLKGELTAADGMSVQALRKENTNLKADALTNSLAGGGDASADNTSSSTTLVEASAAKLTSGSDMLLKADNNIKLNRAEGYNEMLWGQGYSGLVGVNTAGVDNSITAATAVRLQDSSLQSKQGHVQLAGQSGEDLLVNAYVYSLGMIDATETRVTNNITNDNRIELTNSNIKTSTAYKNITLAAADDLKLYTSAVAETPIGVVAGSNAVVKNALQRTNALGLYGAGELYSMNDISYYAGKHLDGSLGRLELDAQAINYNGGVIPVVLSPSLNNEVTQQNELFMQSGASNSVRHTNIYADAGEELVFVHTGRDTSYGGDEEGGYVTEDTGSKHYNKLDKNSVDINGSMAAGMDNKINIVVGAAGDITLFDEDERKSLTNKTALSKEELQGKITVAGSDVLDAQGKPTGAHSGLTEETAASIKDSIKLGSIDYAQTLMNRYNEIMVLISEYASDGDNSASYIGYKAEAERLLTQMEKMGEVSYVDGKYVLNARKMVDYVELPELTASGGNITINTSVLKSRKATGSLSANGSPEINVTNNTNLMLRLQRINVDDGGGRLLYNNEQLTGSTSSDFNDNISKLNKKAGAASGDFKSVKSETGIGGSINIKGNYNGAPLDYRVVEDGKASEGQYLPQADIIVSGDVYNKNGSIKITSQHNNITIAGASAQDSVSVLGANVALSAGGSITQTFTDGIVNIDHDPQSFFNKYYDKLKNNKENIYDITGPYGEPYDGMEPKGSFIAGGVISINATDINVDGIVQSGYGDYVLSMKNDKNVEAAIDKIKSSYKEGDKLTDDYVKGNEAYRIVKGSAYWDYDAKCYKYRIGAYYNPASNTIILEDVNASGGQIYLTGRISSIGAGRLYCLDGTSNITIESNHAYNMKLGSLITNDVKGRVSITDTAGYSVYYNNKKIPVSRVTEYTNGMMETYYVSSGGTKYEYMAKYFDGAKGGQYQPKAGLRYTWTSGTKNTDYKRYTHDDMDGGWGLWDLEEKDKDLQEWSTQENLTGSGSSANEARKDGVVVQETNDTRKTFMEYEHNQLGEPVRTIESERYYSTGLFGCHKHHEVTWKEETGSTDTYFASAKADYPIEVKFLGQKAEESVVKVHNVMGGIEMSGSIGNTQLYEGTDAAGNITHNTKGTVWINSGRIIGGDPVKQSGGALYGRLISVAGTGNLENINIVAGDDVYLKLKSWSQAGGAVTVNVSNLAGAKGRLHLDANSGELSESGYRWKLLDITNSSGNGDIIYAGYNAIEADRINLTAANGSIYGDGGSALKIKAGQTAADDDSLSASINVKAKGDINIEQVEGNLRLGRVYSSTGDVTLKSAGSIIDALPEEAAAKGSEESRLQRWKNIGLIEGGNSRLQEIKSRLNQEKGLGSYAAWDKTALLYAVSESILQKTAASLDQTSKKDPNVIGRNITLTANGSIGQRGETKEITLTGILAKNADGSYKNANALNDLKTLGQADVTNVTLRKDADGKQIAVIDETQTLGIQQTTSNGQGKINIQAAAKGGQGDIFLQGREEVSIEKSFAGRASKDLNIETLMTGNGRATVTSLGSINKLAAEPEAVNIQAQSLYLTAINGVGSTGALNVSLYGQDEANDGLSVISGGAVAINQLGDKQLVLQHLSTGKDAGSYLKILADNDIVLHGDAPDSESITLQSLGGSITAGELTGTDITLSARNGSLAIGKLKAQGLLRAEAERMHFGDASIGHGSIRAGKEAVFDRLRTHGLAQFQGVSQYQVYDLGDGLQLRLTAGGRRPYDSLVLFGNALHEFSSQRLYATGLLERKLEYDVYEKLVEPHIRPKILFDRFNLIEQDEDEENKIEQIDVI
ncbi:leukotoxin LktA family filamentous adhesin [uncultured Phascolarctobacterium sp.]|jgi:filamentous hemagglutinin family protein|uniref:leukotoxin LktA family filamentous adhesin n=1 Tax=uncultured Phascolarctobacterium sp. TaxID=512296 RepID=UPI0025D31FFB|nr:leukotoxin LktA family filamentous adhesin [uncultured Phascolarctobacterium sp.]